MDIVAVRHDSSFFLNAPSIARTSKYDCASKHTVRIAYTTHRSHSILEVWYYLEHRSSYYGHWQQ